VPAFPSVELGQNTAAIGFVVDIAQHVERLDDPAKFLQRPREGRRSVMGLEGYHQAAGLDQTQLQRTGQARAELVAKEPKNAEDHVGVCTGIGHDFGRLKLCLLFEHEGD